MSRDAEISNQWFAFLESCAKWKLLLFVPSGFMLCVLLLFVEGSVLSDLGVCSDGMILQLVLQQRKNNFVLNMQERKI
jgi:hypothetical protein